MNGIQNPGVLDAFAHDTRANRLVLAMYETRPWEGGEQQLFQLQEKLNAYLSFLLDGEMTESFPQLAGLPAEIQLRAAFEPPEEAWELIRRAREQIKFQNITLEVVQMAEGEEPPDGSGCCGGGGGGCCCSREEEPEGCCGGGSGECGCAHA